MPVEQQRTLPHNLEAERSVLGAILIENFALNEAAAVITGRDFFRDAHRRIYERMMALADRKQPIDMVSVKEALEKTSELEEVGGPAYVASLVDGVPRSTNVEYYAKIVKEKATLRNLIFAANHILGEAYGSELEADEILNSAESLVMAVAQSSIRGDFIFADELVKRSTKRFLEAHENPRIVNGVPSGIKELDRRTRGFQPGEVTYLAAGTSRGKSALMMQFACAAATGDDVGGIISLEMSADSLIDRAVAQLAGVDGFRMKTGHLTAYEQTKCQAAFDQLSNARLAVDDVVGLTATQMRAKVRRFAAKHGLKALFIDYVQLMHEDGRFNSRNEELTKISRGLKLLAGDLNIPIIVLSQLSRSGTKDDEKPPTLADLRESGALEQDADVVLLIWRHTDNGEKVVDLIIAKQRNGPTDTIRLRWFAEQMRFASPDEQQDEPQQPEMAL